MTRAILCNRSVNVSYDDFVIPSILSVIIHSLWLLIIILIYIIFNSLFLNNESLTSIVPLTTDTNLCFSTHIPSILIYGYSLLGFSIFTIIIDISIYYLSSLITVPILDFSLFLSSSSSSVQVPTTTQDLIHNKQKLYDTFTKYIEPLHYLLLLRIILLNILDILFATLGIINILYYFSSCTIHSTSTWTINIPIIIYGILSISILIQAILYPNFILILICCGSTRHRTSSTSIDELLYLSSQRWRGRCKRFSFLCRGIQEADHSFTTVGNVLAGAFEALELTKLSTSDIMTALALVRVQQKDKERYILSNLQQELSNINDNNNNNTIVSLSTSSSTNTLSSSTSITFPTPSTDNNHTSSSEINNPPLSTTSSTSSSLTSSISTNINKLLSQSTTTISTSFRNTIQSVRSEATQIRNYSINMTGTYAVNPLTNKEDYQRLIEASKYSTYAVGNYGCLLYTYMNTWRTCYRLPYDGISQCYDNFQYRNSNNHHDDNNNIYQQNYYNTYIQQQYPDHRPSHSFNTYWNCNDITLRSSLTRTMHRSYNFKPTIPPSSTIEPGTNINNESILYSDHQPISILVQSTNNHPISTSPSTKTFPSSLILHNSYVNMFFTVPWYICIDKHYQDIANTHPTDTPLTGALVISARGSLSPEDFITDGLAVPYSLNNDEDGKLILKLLEQYYIQNIDHYPGLTNEKIIELCNPTISYVHAGMWKAATAIRKKLFQYNLLLTAYTKNTALINEYENFLKGIGIISTNTRSSHPNTAEILFGPSNMDTSIPPSTNTSVSIPPSESVAIPISSSSSSFPTSSSSFSSSSNGTLQLIICGHSLGSGVASLLALQLKCFYPQLRCYAYSIPGAVVSTNLAYLMESFVTSIVLGKDMVGRLSIPSITKLSNHMVNSLVHAKQSKTKILCSCYYGDQQWPASGCCIHSCGIIPYTSDNLLDKQTITDYNLCSNFFSSNSELVLNNSINGTEKDTNLSSSSINNENNTSNTIQEIIYKQRQLFSLPMHIPGKIVHLVRYQKYSIDWITYLCIKLWSINLLWSYGKIIGETISNLFCCCFRRTKSRYIPRYSPSIYDRHSTSISTSDTNSIPSTVSNHNNTQNTNNLLSLDEFLISPYMISDHMPDKVERVLTEIIDEFLPK